MDSVTGIPAFSYLHLHMKDYGNVSEKGLRGQFKALFCCLPPTDSSLKERYRFYSSPSRSYTL